MSQRARGTVFPPWIQLVTQAAQPKRELLGWQNFVKTSWIMVINCKAYWYVEVYHMKVSMCKLTINRKAYNLCTNITHSQHIYTHFAVQHSNGKQWDAFLLPAEITTDKQHETGSWHQRYCWEPLNALNGMYAFMIISWGWWYQRGRTDSPGSADLGEEVAWANFHRSCM